MKVVVLGGSSFSTPSLIQYLASRNDVSPITMCLVGRTGEHLDAVARASCLLARGSLVTIETDVLLQNSTPALSDAEVVIIQVRVGGYAGRRYDETFPHEFNLCGDEGLGVGGLSAAWRAWPSLHNLLTSVERNCPEAQIILLSSPIGLLVRLARLDFPKLRVTGICELPYHTLCSNAQSAGMRWADLDWDYIGINHIGWFYRIRAAGSTVITPLAPLALKYVQLHDTPQPVLAEQKANPGGRAEELTSLQKQALSVYASGNLADVEQALLLRNANWYAEAVGPLVATLAGGAAESLFFLSIPQCSAHSMFAPDDILELPHVALPPGRLSARQSSSSPPERLVLTLRRFLAYERIAADAVLRRDGAAIAAALSVHPWVCSLNDRAITKLAARVCQQGPPLQSPQQ